MGIPCLDALLKGLTALLEESWELEGIGDGVAEAAGEGLDDTYSRQLKELPVDEDGGEAALEKPTAATGEKSRKNLPSETSSKLDLRFEANIGGVDGARTGGEVDGWGGEADLAAIFDEDNRDGQQVAHQSSSINTAWQLPETGSKELASTVLEQENNILGNKSRLESRGLPGTGVCSPPTLNNQSTGGSDGNQQCSGRSSRSPEFTRPIPVVEVSGDNDVQHKGNNDHQGWSGSGARSPVLTKQMFQTGETPGCDAVYLNSIKDEQDQYDEEEVEEEELETEEKRRSKNPFIDYESRVGSKKSPEPRLPTRNEDDPDVWARGQLVADSGENIQPVRLVQPRQTFSSFPPNPQNGRKRKAPDQARKDKEEMGRIEDFFERKAKLLHNNGGDNISLGGQGGGPTLTRRGELATVQVDFKVAELHSWEPEEERGQAVVGRVDQGGWVVKEEDCLAILSPGTLREAVLNHSLQSSHILRQEKLPEALEVKVTPALQGVALSLATSRCPPGISDKRLVHNGLQVEVRSRQGGAGCCLMLTGVCPDLNLGGCQRQEMVREVLTSIGEGCEQLERCRPASVREHLVAEAARVGSEAPGLTRSEVEEMLSFCRQQEIATCPHDKPLLSALCEIT